MQNTSLVRARSLPKDRSLARYLEQIRTFEVLTLEEEQKLFLRYRDDGDKAAGERLILSNLHTVVKVARRYYSQFASFFDLIQEGNVGLMQAIDRYDPTKGVPYSTYARYWIRAMILKYVMDNHRLVKVGGTRSGRRMFFELNRERNRLLQLGEEASPQVLSQQLGIDVEEVEAVAAALAPEEWIDAPREGHSWHDTMQAPNSDPEDLVSRGNLAQVLRGALDTFSETVTCRCRELR